MKPARFDYERPRDMRAALGLVAGGEVSAKVLAGGQSLGPMLNMRLVQPDLVVDITGIPELRRVEPGQDALVLGACVTHADIEDGRAPDVTRGAMPAVAGGIAYRAVRSRGTIGGSLTNADPSADWVSALAALGAEVLVRGAQGTKVMPVEDYVTGALECALAPGELLDAVRIPVLSRAARWGYYKVCRKTGEYAQAIGAVLIDPERGVCRAVVGATEARPIVLRDARALFGGRTDKSGLAAFDSGAVETVLIQAGLADRIDRRVYVAALRRAAGQALDS